MFFLMKIVNIFSLLKFTIKILKPILLMYTWITVINNELYFLQDYFNLLYFIMVITIIGRRDCKDKNVYEIPYCKGKKKSQWYNSAYLEWLHIPWCLYLCKLESVYQNDDSCHLYLYFNYWFFRKYFFFLNFPMLHIGPKDLRPCGRDHMVVGFITTHAISAYHH